MCIIADKSYYWEVEKEKDYHHMGLSYQLNANIVAIIRITQHGYRKLNFLFNDAIHITLRQISTYHNASRYFST